VVASAKTSMITIKNLIHDLINPLQTFSLSLASKSLIEYNCSSFFCTLLFNTLNFRKSGIIKSVEVVGIRTER